MLTPSYNDEGLPNYNLILILLLKVTCKLSSSCSPSQKPRVDNITFEKKHFPQNISIEGVRKEVRPYILRSYSLDIHIKNASIKKSVPIVAQMNMKMEFWNIIVCKL